MDLVKLRSLGRGANGGAYTPLNFTHQGLVLKEGYKVFLWEEAEKMHRLNHPNLAHLYCKIRTGKIGPGGCEGGWLAMKPLGATLASFLARRPDRRCLHPSSLCYFSCVCLSVRVPPLLRTVHTA